MYYICPHCETACQSYPPLNFHIRGRHPDMEPVPKENIETMEEVPEGYNMVGKPKAEAAESTEGSAPAGVMSHNILTLTELPTEPVELFYTIMKVKGIPDNHAIRLKHEFRLSPWMWNDAQEIQAFLKGSKLGVSADWIRAFLKQYGNAVKIEGDSPVSFFGKTGGVNPEYFGQFGASPGQFGASPGQFGAGPGQFAYRNFPMYQDRPAGLTDEAKAELDKLREENAAIKQQQQELLARLQQEREERNQIEKETALEKRFEKMEALITKVAESKKGASDGSASSLEHNSWFKAFMDEREERRKEIDQLREEQHKHTIDQLTQQLANATEAVTKTQDRVSRAKTEVLEEERQRRTEIMAELDQAGYAPRKKDTEEHAMEMIKETLMPGVVQEVREGRRLLEKVLTGGQESHTRSPLTPEQAAVAARLMQIEQAVE